MSSALNFDPATVRLAQNFTLLEFIRSGAASRHQIDNRIPIDCRPGQPFRNLLTLAETVLQPLRDEFGTVIITSGYRCKALNLMIGGAVNSQHQFGQAADIQVPGVSPYGVATWIEANLTFDQLILEFQEWVHVSIAATPRLEVLTAFRAAASRKAIYTPSLHLADSLPLELKVNHEPTS